jgi:flagellar basal body-associated protein FliL
MVAKLVIFLVVLAILFCAVMVTVLRYFQQKESHEHEERMRRLERDERLLSDDHIERELDRERED